MKLRQAFSAAVALAGVAFIALFGYALRAQIASSSTEAARQPVISPFAAQVAAEGAELQEVSLTNFNRGTFWSSQRNWPPLPFVWFSAEEMAQYSVKIYTVGAAERQVFLINDLDVPYEELNAAREVERLAARAAMGLPLTDEVDLSQFSPMALSASYPPGALYLEIQGVNSNASLVVHGTDSAKVYSLTSKTNLANTNNVWETEQVFQGASGQDYTPLWVPVGDRTNNFFRAMEWSSNDAASTGLSVALTNPTNGAYFNTWPTNITLTATATQTNGSILAVAFYNEATLLGLVQGPAASYSLVWSNVLRGRYTLTARAFNDLGGCLTSSPTEISVDPCYPAVDVMLVVDRSGSMANNNKFNNARLACSNFVSTLNFPADQAGIVSFATTTSTDRTLINSSNAVLTAIGQIPAPSGNTYMSNALRAAQAELGSVRHNTSALPVMLFLSDGQPTDSTNAVLAAASQAKAANTRIFTIGIGDVNAALMQQIATSPSDYFYSTNGSASDLAALFNTISAKLCRSGVISVAITSPTNGATFALGQPLTLQANASSSSPDGSIALVQFYNGTAFIGTAAPGASNSFSFTWTSAPLGTNVLTAVAFDNTDATKTSAAITTRVIAVPGVNLVSPANGTSFATGTNITLVAEAWQTDGASITNVRFLSDGAFLGSVTTGATNLYTFTWTGAQAGTHTVTAIARDSDGLSNTSPAITLQVYAPISVSVTWPSNDAVFVAPATVPIEATVSDPAGLLLVEFFANGASKGKDRSSTSNPFRCPPWAGVSASNYTLTATAANNLGAWAASTGIVIHVVPPVQVNAGTNRLVLFTGSSVTVTQYGSITGGYNNVTSCWAQASGPGLGALSSSNGVAGVTFTNVGDYLLRLSASDGYSSNSDVVTLSVQGNAPPVVTAGPDRTIPFSPTSFALLSASVTDDGLPLPSSVRVSWTNLTAGVTILNPTNLTAVATNFASNGVYHFQVVADDGLLKSTGFVQVVAAPASSRTWTLNADFEEGTLLNVNYDQTASQLQLNHLIQPLPFVWVACSARGTVVRIDANTGEVLGEYWSAPDNMGRNPSRTTVDRDGNVWVGNRDETGWYGPGGSITRIGLVIGGTRGSLLVTNIGGNTVTNFVEDAGGEYLKPPFKYCTAIDRNHDGYIHTSAGLGRVLGWSNVLTNGAETTPYYDSPGTRSNGGTLFRGVETADDECIINYTRVAGTAVRTIAVDANNDVWTLGHNDAAIQKVEGATGLPLLPTGWAGALGYGGLIDPHGVLWSACNPSVLRFDPAILATNTSYSGEIVDSGASYGIGIDPLTGQIWFSRYSDSGDTTPSVARLAPDGAAIGNYCQGNNNLKSRGVAVDDQGNVWVAHGNEGVNGSVAHLRTDGTYVGSVYLACNTFNSTGVAVDANGKVWVSNCGSHTMMRIDPHRGPIGNGGYPIGEVDLTVNLNTGAEGETAAGPYNYSDMTGYVSIGATAPHGSWSVVHDGGVSNLVWGTVAWTAAQPTNTSIAVEVRASNDQAGLGGLAFRTVTNNQSFFTTNGALSVAGRYLEIRASFERDAGSANTPVLYDLSVSAGTNAVVVDNPSNFAADDRMAAFQNTANNLISPLANDHCPSGAALHLAAVSQPAHGAVTITNSGAQLAYTPAPGFFGQERFTYTATDGSNAFARAVVIVEVGRAAVATGSTNDAPFTLATSDTWVVPGNSPGCLIDVLANDATNDAPLAVSAVTPASHGTVRISACGLIYKPDRGYCGVDQFTYTLINKYGRGSQAEVYLSVTGGPIQTGCGSNAPIHFTESSGVSLLNNGFWAQRYLFSSETVKVVSVSVTNRDDSVLLYLLDGSGSPLASGTNALSYRLPNPGNYIIEADRLPPTSAPYTYDNGLSVDCTSPTGPELGVWLGTNQLRTGWGVDFGVTQPGHPATLQLTLTNAGNAALAISNVTLADGAGFSIANPMSNLSLSPAHSTNVMVQFNAASAGPANTSCLIETSDSLQNPFLILLTAQANPPTIAITSPTKNFTSGMCSQYIGVSAVAGPAASLEKIQIFATSGSVTHLLHESTADTFPGYYYWTPSTPGTYTLFAVATDSNGLSVDSAPVAGVVQLRSPDSPVLRVLLNTNEIPSGATLSFGTVPVSGTNSVTLVLTNASANATLNVSYLYAYSASGTFSLSILDPFSLPPNASTNLVIAAQPPWIGSLDGGAYIYADDGALCSSYFSLNLSAVGFDANSAFTVTVTNPPASSQFIAPTNILVSAQVEVPAEGGVSYVTYYARSATDTTLIGESYNAPYEVVWSGAPAGSYSLFATAAVYDSNYNSFHPASAEVPITVLLRPGVSPIMGVLLNQTNAVPNYSTIDCGTTPVGTPLICSFIITNSGNTDLHLLGFDLTGTGFALTNGPATVAGQSSTNLDLVYSAQEAGLAQAVLTITNDDIAGNPYVITNLARANSANTNAPLVSLTSPAQGAVLNFPADVNLSATASAPLASTIWAINFFVGSPTGSVQIGQALAPAGLTNFTGSAVWWRPGPGVYTLKAVAIDGSGLMGESAAHQIEIKSSLPTNSPPNSAPVARDDRLIVPGSAVNPPTYPIDVLANDTDPDGDSLAITGFTQPRRLGVVRQFGNKLLFTPYPITDAGTNWYGINHIQYEITDSKGATARAWVEVVVQEAPVPSIELVTPQANSWMQQNSGGQALVVPVTALARSTRATNGSIAQVDFYDQEDLIGTVPGPGTNDLFIFSWQTPLAGDHLLSAIATDNAGQQNISAAVVIHVEGKAGNLAPAASISNLPLTETVTNGMVSKSYPVLHEGVFTLMGSAYDLNPEDTCRYQILLRQPDGTLVANITPNAGSNGFHTGSVTSGIIASNLDFSLYENGPYDLELNVYDGWEISTDTARFILDCNLKIGQFSFSVQDLVIPVSGIPLTVTRTYNSLDHSQGAFGYSWSYTLNDVGFQMDENREQTPDVFDEDSEAGWFNRRTGGGRDITVTLPDGRRTTFYCWMDGPHPRPGEDVATWYYPRWQAPPGVRYAVGTLEPDLAYNTITRAWSADGQSTFENYDMAGFVLTNLDGTQFVIEREDLGLHYYLSGNVNDYYAHVYGQGRLSEIKQRDGNRIVLQADSIQHFDPAKNPTRSVWFDRDDQGRIKAIYDPISESSTPRSPLLKYSYDPQTGNLTEVQKLTDRNTTPPTYQSTWYQYTNTHFPHYLTGIVDPRGVQVARTEYGDDGRIKAVVDADGKRTEFSHDLSGQTEVVIDRLGHTNRFVYDLRGNVTNSINALGGITLMAYDANNNKTNEVVFLNGTRYATNRFEFDVNGLLRATHDPLDHGSSIEYNLYGQMTVSVDARGYGATNFYDEAGNLSGTADALGNATTNVYQNGLLVTSRDAIGAVSFNSYDPATGNLTGTSTSDASGILSSNTFGYDLNGARSSSTVWSRVNGTWTPATTTYVLDPQGRVVQTVDAAGTNTVVYNSIGKQAQAIDKLGRVTSFDYDNQGRLFRITYPDLTTEIAAFDSNGNRTNSVDRSGRPTGYILDALNRVVGTTLADGATNGSVFDDVGRVVRSVDSRGVASAFGYDSAGRRTSVTNALGTAQQSVYRYGFDENGNQLWALDPSGVGTTNVFDPLNRQVEIRFADGTKKLTGFDAGGRRVAETNQDSIVTLSGFDGAGRLTSVTNAFGTTNQMVTRYEFDEAGNQVAQIDALNRTNTFGFNLLGQRIWHKLPEGQVERFAHDAVGNLIYHTNFNAAVITNRYDLMNRLTNRSSINGYSVGFSYTPTGQRETMTDASGVTSYEYDLRDRLRLKAEARTGGAVFGLRYSYDVNGGVTNIWSDTPSGVNLVYAYDSLNRITNVLASGSQAASYRFDLNGNLQSIRYGNGVTNLYQYTALNQLTNLVWWSNQVQIGSFYYQLGKTGNRTNLSETLNGTTRSYGWAYDKLYRLTSETIGGFGTVAYAHDAVGNRTNRLSNINQIPQATNTYSANDWLKTDAYDSNGNTLYSTNGAVAGPYGYDVENRLTSFGSAVRFSYNGDGARVAKSIITSNPVIGNTTNTTYYLVDDRNPTGYAQVLEEHQSTGGAATLSRVYAYGLALVNQREVGGATYYFASDGHGSTRLLLDSSAAVANAFAYDAYGSLIASNTAPQTAYLYCGEQFDSELGFYYLRAPRYLNPGTGRFTTMDSFEGHNDDPLSLHKYLYAHANPVNGTDPTGHDLIGTLSSISIGAYLGATTFLATYGALAETAAFVTALSILNSAQVLSTGIDPDTGEPATVMATAFAIVDFLPAGKFITRPLKEGTKRIYWRAARDIWDGLSKVPRGTGRVHHRIPLEWAHLFPNMNPNRINNLKLVPQEIHEGADGVGSAWTRFRNSLGGRTPTPQEVLDKAADIDTRFGKYFKDLE